MSSPTPSDHGHRLSYIVVNHDSPLGKLIQKSAGCKGRYWKHGGIQTAVQESINHVDVVNDIKKFLEDTETVRYQVSSIHDQGMSKVLEKIKAVIEQLIKDDPATETHYRDLIPQLTERADNIFSKQSSSDVIVDSTFVDTQNHAFPKYKHYWLKDELDFEASVTKLTVKEKKCLSFCISLMSTVINVEIKKRDLIQWWMGMELIDDASEGDQILQKFVEEEFILQTFTIRSVTPSNWYTMEASVISKLKACEQFMAFRYEATQMDRHLIMYHQNNEGIPQESLDPEKLAAVMNIGDYTLNVDTFEWLNRLKNVKVVHLGSWHYYMDYIVVEDRVIRTLKSLKKLKDVRFLSLQGISRVEELPISVYSLTKLKVLDLRACQDLRTFPKGIESLQQLMCLDLSMCYQLSHIPKAIISLSNLTVLKGFLINSQSSAASSDFSDLKRLEKLQKLTIRTKRMSFPTSEDAQILLEMQKLEKLKIGWVISSPPTGKVSIDDEPKRDELNRLPSSLQKLELQAAPGYIASGLLGLISNRNDHKSLKKLYVIGGGLEELDINKFCFPHVKIARFRHLAHLHINWYDFKQQFPSLTRVEILQCPNFIFFPCNGNGVCETN